MALIKPDRSRILKEATLRSLNGAELGYGQSLKTSQLEGLKSYYRFLDETTDASERRHGFFDMATATGKTGLFSLIARHAHRIAQENGIGDTFRTLIVEPSLFLLNQTKNEFSRIAPEMASSIGVYGGDNRDLTKPITIISYESWLSLLENGQLQGAEIDLNINDEAHKGLSVRRQNMINQVLTDTHHLGFTASSQYDREKTMELTHRNLIYRIGLREAVEGGMLTDYVHVQYGVMRLLPAEMNQDGVHLSNADFTFLKRREWSRLVTHAYRELEDGVTGQPLSDKVGIIFAADTKHADSVAQMLNNDPTLQRKAQAAGFKDVAVPIHTVGHTSSEQNRRMEAFQNGDYMLAVGDKKFQAGFDHPPVKFIASYPGSSLVETVQEMGRATRQYVDPRTGEEQGAVVFEAVPYIGDRDPEADQRARRAALKNLVTARDVLEDTLVLRAGRPQPSSAGTRAKYDKNIALSLGSSAEVFTTWEETLTVSRQIDAAQEEKPNLTENQIISWIKATLERTGRLPSQTGDQTVWSKKSDGGFEIVEDETWLRIDRALRGSNNRKFRGLVEEPSLADVWSLPDLYKKLGLQTDKENLTEEKIAGWIKATLEKTGRLPSQTGDQTVWSKKSDGGFEIVEDETWLRIDGALRGSNNRKFRGLAEEPSLADVWSLPDLCKKLGLRIVKEDLTEEKIVGWIKATFEKTGRLPSAKGNQTIWSKKSDGSFEIVEDETWSGVNSALYGSNNRKFRGLAEEPSLADVWSLPDLCKKLGLRIVKEDLTEEKIVGWIKATFEKTGRLPSANGNQTIWSKKSDGSFEIVKVETWGRVHKALYGSNNRKFRGLENETGLTDIWSLLALLKKHQFVRPKSHAVVKQKNADATPADMVEIAQKVVTDLFSQLSSDLVNRIAEQVAQKIGGDPKAVGVKGQIVRPQRRKVTEPKNIETPIVEAKPLPVVMPITSTEVQTLASQPVLPLMPTASLMHDEQPVGQSTDLSKLASLAFKQVDASGDTMLSCLQNAERDLANNNRIGFLANLRKFVELFTHHTLLSVSERFLSGIDMPAERRQQALKIARDYRHDCHDVQLSAQNPVDGKVKRLELAGMLRSLSGLVKTMSSVDPEKFPKGIIGRTRNIAAAASEIHLQVTPKQQFDHAELLQGAYGLTWWFDARFGKTEATASVKAVAAEVTVPAPKPETTQPLQGSILKTLGVSQAEFAETVSGPQDSQLSLITNFAENWLQEDKDEKLERNRVISSLYKQVQPTVEQMLADGKKVAEIAAELNKAVVSRDDHTGGQLTWTPEFLLRGAVLNRSSLPLSSFVMPPSQKRQPDRSRKLTP